MIRFFIKGLLRDRQRSLLPIIVVSLGVMLAVFMQAWITGILGDIFDFNSKFATGHVKIMTEAYSEIKDQRPNDLAIMGSEEFIKELETKYPEMKWAERIMFGGLMDSPDARGETKEQGPAMGMAVDLLGSSQEIERLNLDNILTRGELPNDPFELLLSELFAENLNVNPGDQLTLISSTMYGAMSITNFTVSGTIRFGAPVLDRGGVIADISGIRMALDMQDAVGEILGYFGEENYNDEMAISFSNKFNSIYNDPSDKFAPVMLPLSKQDELLSGYLVMVDAMQGIIIGIFLVAMAIVLWNAGLLGGLRRYGEMGLRMAMGEHKGHIYRSLISESLIIGIVGSVVGTAMGIGLASLLEQGVDFSDLLEGSTMMMSGIYRTVITTETYYIGFIPGIFATFIGTALAGIGIYRRQTANLFKELQA
jgi:putative ABC transport system permease protein